MNLSKKFLYVNPSTSNADNARLFPLSNLNAIYEENATSVWFVFKDAGNIDDTVVDITVDSGKAKDFIKEFAESVAYSKSSILQIDNNGDLAFSSHVDFGTAPTITEGA